MWKTIKSFILSRLTAKDIPGSYEEYNYILLNLFKDSNIATKIHEDLIRFIVNSDFIIDPNKLILYYRNNYDFTLNEFFILLLKLGILTRFYTNNFEILLKDALAAPYLFSSERYKSLLKMQESNLLGKEFNKNDKILKKLQDNEFVNNNDVNKLIDEWIIKNKNK